MAPAAAPTQAQASVVPTPYPYPVGPAASTAQPTPISTYMMGAMIVSAITGIMLLVGDFGGGYWRNYYAGVEGWVYIGPWETWYGFLIMVPLSMAMLYLAWRSLRGMREPVTITPSFLRTGFLVSLGIACLMLVLGVAWAAYAISEEYDDWWFDAGFYGGLVGGLIAAVIFQQARKQLETSPHQQGGPAMPEEGELAPYDPNLEAPSDPATRE